MKTTTVPRIPFLIAAACLLLPACKSAPEAPVPAETAAPAPAPSTPATAPAPQPPVPQSSATMEGSTEVFAVKFLQISEAGYPEVELTNLTDKDIVEVKGAFQARDATGKLVWSTGLTVAVPDRVFLAAGESRVATPFGLKDKEDMMEILRTNPDSLSFSFVARDVRNAGE